MFTPPASPPPKGNRWAAPATPSTSRTLSLSSTPISQHHPLEDQKRRTGRRFRLLVLIVPLVVIAITASARLLTQEHPSYDLNSLSSSLWRHSLSRDKMHLKSHSLHRRQEPDAQSNGGSSASGKPSATSAPPPSSSSPLPPASQPVPSVPSTPPALPTPFTQPFDGNIPQNFSSLSCSEFFTNMTNTQPFRSCRPFSLLLQTSDAFISAQQNLTLLNELVWGTCNTRTEESQCVSNMKWFAESLRQNCAADLRDSNALAVDTLLAIEAYAPMREAGCLIDPTTNTYCFVNAARDSNPANFYYYSLPLGIKLPPKSDPQCNSCLKSLMGVYSTSLKNNTDSSLSTLPGLVETYEKAAELTLGKCGVGYALTGVAGSATGTRLPDGMVWRTVLGVMASVMMGLLVNA